MPEQWGVWVEADDGDSGWMNTGTSDRVVGDEATARAKATEMQAKYPHYTYEARRKNDGAHSC